MKQDVIDMIMSGNMSENTDTDEYSEKLWRAASSPDVPEWVRRAAQRIVAQGIDKVSYEEVGLGLHDNIVESAVIGTEGERFFKIVMNFEEAIKNMRGF